MLRLTTVSLTALLVAACSSTPPAATPAPAPAPAPVAASTLAPAPAAPVAAAPAPAPSAAPQAAAAPQASAAPLAAHLDPASALSRQRSVFFDYDQFVIRSQDRATAELHGKYLSDSADVKVTIEGNADERGSREYNLALGQKRAQAVVQALKLMGARDNQIEAVSYGEERPADTGRDEAAWAKNRRADIVYKK